MSLFEFGRLIYRNIVYLIAIPVLLAALVFVFTLNQKKQYASSALLYTGIASGFNIESGSSDKVDYHAVNNAFDNIISIVESRQTTEEVLLRMLANHIVIISNAKQLPTIYQEYLTDRLSIKQLANFYHSQDIDSTYNKINELFHQNDPVLIDIIRGENRLYSAKILSTLEVKRHKSSDMLKLYYTAENPLICKEVVELVIQVFTSRYRAIKVAETGDVVAYFQSQLNSVKSKLNKAEDKLTDFRTGKRVINYEEQTKAIATKKQNALEEYANKKMNLLATQVALNEIEEKLKVRENLLEKNSDLLDKRNRLDQLVQQLARSQSSIKMDSSQYEQKQEIEKIKKEIKKDMETAFAFSNSKEGLPSKQLLNEWLKNVIALSREKANVANYKNRLKELDALYDNFAPLGSNLARLEREISVAEREYLQILSGLNMSKLRQQNLQLSSQLEVVDWPPLPSQALASKRKLLVAVGFIFGLIAVLSLLIGKELLNDTINTPSKAESRSKLELIGAYPIIHEKLNTLYPDLVSRIKSLSVTKLIAANAVNRLIIVFSAQKNEGKSKMVDLIADELRASSFEVQVVKPYDDNFKDQPNCQTYQVNSSLNQASSLKDFNIQTKEGFTILELPALTFGKIPYELIRLAQHSIMIARADKSWSLLQSKIIKDWKKEVGTKPSLILNGVKPYHLEEFIGDIGTKHNKLVEGLKKIAKFEFGANAFNSL